MTPWQKLFLPVDMRYLMTKRGMFLCSRWISGRAVNRFWRDGKVICLPHFSLSEHGNLGRGGLEGLRDWEPIVSEPPSPWLLSHSEADLCGDLSYFLVCAYMIHCRNRHTGNDYIMEVRVGVAYGTSTVQCRKACRRRCPVVVVLSLVLTDNRTARGGRLPGRKFQTDRKSVV